jgi:hypothetical protein
MDFPSGNERGVFSTADGPPGQTVTGCGGSTHVPDGPRPLFERAERTRERQEESGSRELKYDAWSKVIVRPAPVSGR